MAERGGLRSTSWEKGVSGNPSGLRRDGTPSKQTGMSTKRPIDVKALARKSTPLVIRTLRAAVANKDKTVPWPTRVHAGEVLLDRAYGKPLQTIDITAILGAFDLTRLTDDELETWEQLCHQAAGPTIDREGSRAIIEGELAQAIEDGISRDSQSNDIDDQPIDITEDDGEELGAGQQADNAGSHDGQADPER